MKLLFCQSFFFVDTKRCIDWKGHGQKCFPLEVFDYKDDISRNVDDEAGKGWQFIQVESVNGSNEDELRAGRSMQGHRKGELQIQ